MAFSDPRTQLTHAERVEQITVEVEQLRAIAAGAVAEVKRLRLLNAELVESLREINGLLQMALLCTTVEIARDAMPYVDKAEVLLIRATGKG